MSSSIEQALNGLVRIFTLAKRPLPDPGTIRNYQPDVTGLTRDEAGLVMQLGEGRPDGGDSANRTGILSFCNSALDQRNLPSFMVGPGVMTRHPTQAPWNNPLNCSRDQLIAYIGGCWRAGRSDIVQSLLHAHASRVPPFTCQNIEADSPGTTKMPPVGDLLSPHEIMYFRVCAGDYSAALDLPAQLSLYLAILTTPSSVDTELNQIISLSTVCGQLDIFVENHRNFPEVLHHYWSGEPWRGQRAIATALIDVVNLESARYSPVSILDILLPAHLLEALKGLDLGAEVQGFLTGNPAQFAQLSARFIVAALRDVQDHIAMLVHSLATLDAIAREVTGAAIVALRATAAQAFGEVSKLLDQSKLDPTGISGIVLGLAASLLGLGSSGDDAAEAEFRQRTTLQLNNIIKNTEMIIKAVSDLQASMEQHFAALSALIREEFYTLVLERLKAEIRNASILLAFTPEEKRTAVYRERAEDQVDRLRPLILRAASYGPGTLAYCFQAYGVVVALLNAGGHGALEIELTRNDFARTPFQSLLEAPEGPLLQWRRLQQIELDDAATLAQLQQECLIGVHSVQVSKLYYPRKPSNGKPWDGEPIEVGDDKWINTGYFARISGDIEQAALLKDIVTERPLAISTDALASVEAVRRLDSTLPLSSELVFKYEYVNHYARGSDSDRDAVSLARVTRARASSQRYVEARRLQPDLEALVTGVKAAFGL